MEIKSYKPLPLAAPNTVLWNLSYKDSRAKLFTAGVGDFRGNSHQLWMGRFRHDSGKNVFIQRPMQRGNCHFSKGTLLAWSFQALSG